MRICHVITRLILGGAQENTLLTCEDLQRIYGDEVLLVTGPPIGPEGSLLERARKNDVPTIVISEMRRAVNPWFDAIAYRKLYQVLRQFRPEVVHTHSAKAGILGRAAASQLGIPAIVHTVHGAPFHEYQNPLAWYFCWACERWASRRCHALISVADAMTDLMVKHRVAPRQKFVTIYSGMEVEPFLAAELHRQRIRTQLGYGDQDVVIGKVARLFHLKGHEFLIESARAVIRQAPNARFLLVGDGILRHRLERKIAEAELTPYFRLVGLVPPEQIPQYLAAMDIVVHVSLREGLARVLPQALIVGRPVVSFDVHGAREVVIPEITGFLVRPCDTEQLTESIVRLAKDTELRQRMGQEGRRRFSEQFRHEVMTKQIRDLYEKILSGRMPDSNSFR